MNADWLTGVAKSTEAYPASEAVEDLIEKMAEIEAALNIQYDKLVKAGILSEQEKRRIVRRERNKKLFGINYQEEPVMKNEKDSQEDAAMENKKGGNVYVVLKDDPDPSDFESEEEYQKAREIFIKETLEMATRDL